MLDLIDRLCAHEDPVVAHRARRLLAGEGEHSRAVRKLREAVGSSVMARRLLTLYRNEPFNLYRKWQGPHWTLYSLAEIGLPPGNQVLLSLRDRVLDWMLGPTFLKAPLTVLYPDQPDRPRRCASMEGNSIWSQLVLGIVDEERAPLLVDRLIRFQWPDGGWNCDKREGARTSSVQETLLPLRGLARWAQAVATREREGRLRAPPTSCSSGACSGGSEMARSSRRTGAVPSTTCTIPSASTTCSARSW